MRLLLEGKTALVTGGASGIGRASALAFSREGANVVVADIDSEGGDETVRLVNERGGKAVFFRMDVLRAGDVRDVVSQAVATYGGLDCALNSAGVEGALETTAEASEENWDRTVGINLKGVWLCMKYEIAQMLKQGGGSVVNTSSGAGLSGVPASGPYVASKHGVVGLTKTAAIEYGKSGIRVNVICPGMIQTPMAERFNNRHPGLIAAVVGQYPMGRSGKPEEIAEAAVWLCSDAASYVSGLAMPIDGGFCAR